jgi:glycine dehydrogenase
MIADFSDKLCAITGYDAISMQPNSGAQGEYAGLLTG